VTTSSGRGATGTDGGESEGGCSIAPKRDRDAWAAGAWLLLATALVTRLVRKQQMERRSSREGARF
jgi:hypothetical protein